MTRARKILLCGLVASVGILCVRLLIPGQREDALPGAPLPSGGGPWRDFVQPGDVLPDIRLTDQHGRRFRISDLRGRAFALSFLYTHCSMPVMCPRLAAKLADVQKRLRQRGLVDARIVLISFDPDRDTSERLEEFGRSFGFDFSRCALATGAPEEVERLSRSLHTYYAETEPGVFNHNVVVSLIDGAGKLRDRFFGTEWEPTEIVDALAALPGSSKGSKHASGPMFIDR